MVQQTWVVPTGTYAALTGRRDGLLLNVISVYVPPRLHAVTFPELSVLILQLQLGILLIGGDFNLTVQADQDRWLVRVGTPVRSPLADFLQALGLADIWRARNQDVRQYTFHSGAHGSLSRIDYLLAPLDSIHLYTNIKHLARGISDHSPLLTTITLQQSQRRDTINPWYLMVQRCVKPSTRPQSSIFQKTRVP